jgi:RimJ/RimL family protein N-acetyltransferase
VRLERLGLEVAAPVRYRSATGQHAYQLPATLARPGGAPAPLDHVTLAALLGRELAFAEGGRARLGEFVTAVASSARNVALFLAGPDRPEDEAGATPFLRAEQALATGHPLHPAAKSRLPMTPGEVGRYAPELGAAFPLHWFRADRSLVAQDSALGTGAAGLLAGDELAGREVRRAADRADGHALVPVHPWQAARLLEQPPVRALLGAGLLADLGPQGRPWSATSSVRTLYRADAPFMLKLSLGVRITNSVRVNLAKELARGVEVHRLLAAGLGEELAARFPWFAIVRDPAWLTVRTGEDRAESGFEVVLRENPYPAGTGTDATVVAALCHPGPGGGPSRLAAVVRELAAAAGRPAAEVAPEGSAPTWRWPPTRCCGCTAPGGSPWRPTSRTAWSSWPGAGRPGSATATTRATTSRRRPPTGCGGCCPASARPATPSATTPWPTSASATTWPSTTCSGSSAPSGATAWPTSATCWPTWPPTWPPGRGRTPRSRRWWRPCSARPGCGSRRTCAPAWTTWTSWWGRWPASRCTSRWPTRWPGWEGRHERRAAGGRRRGRVRGRPGRRRGGQLLRAAAAEDHQQVLIGSVDGEPVSYWECYWAARDPLARHYPAEPADQGVHLLIGPPERTGRGLGRQLLQAVVAWQLGREPATRRVVAEPDVRNQRMIHVFQQCGFRRAGELELPDKRAALMLHERGP